MSRLNKIVCHHLLIFIAVGLLVVPTLAGAEGSPDPLFQDDETLLVTITGPMSTLIDDRPTEGYLSSSFQYQEPDGELQTLDLKIRTRGHFRLKNCDFPPLRLNFKKSQTKGTLFEKQNILKLVTHCNRQARYEQLVLKEYLAYKVFNAITELSFRVRLLRVTYVDSENRRKDLQRYGFLIEHKERLANRLAIKEVSVEESTVSAIRPEQLNLTSVLQFFLGNTDFSPIAGPPDNNCCHNYVLFQDGADPLLAIPYDFDQSGFINAPYAKAHPRFRLRTVRQRLYRGRCVNNAYVNDSLQVFRDQHDAIYSLIENQEGLSNGSRKNLIRFVDQFYELIENPEDVQTKIIEHCI